MARAQQQPQSAADTDLHHLPAGQQRHAVARGAPPGHRIDSGFRLWLGATILLGAVFIFGQGTRVHRTPDHEEHHSRTQPVRRDLFHAHRFPWPARLCGLISLLRAAGARLRRRFRTKREYRGLGAVSMYWHFVDAVWIVIFSLVYLTVWI